MDKLMKVSKTFNSEKYKAFLGQSNKKEHQVSAFNLAFKPNASRMVLRPRVETPGSLAPSFRAVKPKSIPQIQSDTPVTRKPNAAVPRIETAPNSASQKTTKEVEPHEELVRSSKDIVTTPSRTTRSTKSQSSKGNPDSNTSREPEGKSNSDNKEAEKPAKSPARQKAVKRDETPSTDSQNESGQCASSAVEKSERQQRAVQRNEVTSTHSPRIKSGPSTSSDAENTAEQRPEKRPQVSTDSNQRGEGANEKLPQQRAVKATVMMDSPRLRSSSKVNVASDNQEGNRPVRRVAKKSPLKSPVAQKTTAKPKAPQVEKKRKFDDSMEISEWPKRKRTKLEGGKSNRPISPIFPVVDERLDSENEDPIISRRVRDEPVFSFKKRNPPMNVKCPPRRKESTMVNDRRYPRHYPPTNHGRYRDLNASYGSIYSQRSGVSRPLQDAYRYERPYGFPLQHAGIDSSGFKIPGAPVRSKSTGEKLFNLFNHLVYSTEDLEMSCNEHELDYLFDLLDQQVDQTILRETSKKEQLPMSIHNSSTAYGLHNMSMQNPYFMPYATGPGNIEASFVSNFCGGYRRY